MRLLISALALATALPVLAVAGPHEGGMSRHAGAHHGGYNSLDLTREQKGQIQQIKRDQMQERKNITQRYLDKLPAADRTAMQRDHDANQEKAKKAVRAVLTPDQQKRYDEQQQQREAHRAERAEFEKWKAERDAKKQ